MEGMPGAANAAKNPVTLPFTELGDSMKRAPGSLIRALGSPFVQITPQFSQKIPRFLTKRLSTSPAKSVRLVPV